MGTFVDYPSIHPSTHTIKVNDQFFWQIPIDKIKAQFRSLEIRNEKKNQLEPIRSASTSLWGIKVNGHFFWVDTQDKLKPQFSFTREIIIETSGPWGLEPRRWNIRLHMGKEYHISSKIEQISIRRTAGHTTRGAGGRQRRSREAWAQNVQD